MKKAFATNDISLTSFLILKGVPQAPPTIINNKVTFCFLLAPEHDGLVEQYFQNTILVPPLQYSQTMNSMKTRIFQLLGNQEGVSR